VGIDGAAKGDGRGDGGVGGGVGSLWVGGREERVRRRLVGREEMVRWGLAKGESRNTKGLLGFEF
jgi:hypothetical protein